MTGMWLAQTKWFILFLARAFAPTSNDCFWSFSSQPLIFMSMAAKLSDLVDETSGINLQTEGHVDVPPWRAKDLWEPEALDSSPSCLPSWSPTWRLLSSHPNTEHCLEICVTLTEKLGPIPPPSHSWMAPLVEDMMHGARTRLTKAVVTGLLCLCVVLRYCVLLTFCLYFLSH